MMDVEIPTLLPCPKCPEMVELVTVSSGASEYARCQSCGFMGPEIFKNDDIPEPQRKAAVSRAWNALPRGGLAGAGRSS